MDNGKGRFGLAMANIKAVRVVGLMPFDINEEEATHKWFALLCAPSIGLKLHYDNWVHYRDNPGTGGRRAFYDFTITGEEALWMDSLMKMVVDLKKGGAIIKLAAARDIENEGGWESLEMQVA